MISKVFLAWCALYTLASAQPPSAADLQNAELHVLPVQGNTYMMVGPGGNITIQAGKDGVLLVDTMFAPLAQRIHAEIKNSATSPFATSSTPLWMPITSEATSHCRRWEPPEPRRSWAAAPP